MERILLNIICKEAGHLQGREDQLPGSPRRELGEARSCSAAAFGLLNLTLSQESRDKGSTFIIQSSSSSLSMNAFIMGKAHLGSENSPLPTSTLAVLPFILSSVSSLMWILSLRIVRVPRYADHSELTHSPSEGVPATQHPAQLSEYRPSPRAPTTLAWEVGKDPRIKGKWATSKPFFLLLCCLPTSTVCWAL